MGKLFFFYDDFVVGVVHQSLDEGAVQWLAEQHDSLIYFEAYLTMEDPYGSADLPACDDLDSAVC